MFRDDEDNDDEILNATATIAMHTKRLAIDALIVEKRKALKAP
jgi:hypothetical protein